MTDLCTDVLLGHDFQAQHKRVVFKFNGNRDNFVVPRNVCALSNVSASFLSLFNNVAKECKPIAVKLRQFKECDQEFIRNELNRFYSEGIIQPPVSPWRAQVVVLKDADSGKHRICVDYLQTINLFTELDAYPLPRIDTLVNTLAKYHEFSTSDFRRTLPLKSKDNVRLLLPLKIPIASKDSYCLLLLLISDSYCL